MFVKKECFYLGKILRTHGIHGQMVIESQLPFTKQMKKEPLLVDIDGGLVPFFLSEESMKSRDHQSYFIHFDHICSKEEAERYIGCELYLLHYEAPQEKDDTTKSNELKDYALYDESNTFLGKIVEVLDYSGNILFRLTNNEQEILIPFIKENILLWDNEKHSIQMLLPEGLLDL